MSASPLVKRLAALALLANSLGAQVSRDLRVDRLAPLLPGNFTRWAVVVGISSYKYAPPGAQLKYAHRDAEEFARFLRSREGGAFPAANVRVLTESSATAGGIRAALHSWLPKSAGARDAVYLFFAGHAVDADRGESYFVAHDSDPQNLHATAISFKEVNDALANKIRAASVVLFADVCHSGGIGWTADATAFRPATLDTLSGRDRSFLKLLSARASERSFEDARWGGGHGAFTHAVLSALRGEAERDRDGFVSASELIDYVSRVVPEQTGARQHPRVAGNFDAGAPLASLGAEVRRATAPAATLRLTGTPDMSIYVDHQFRGSIRPSGELVVEASEGEHSLSVDMPGGEPTETPVVLRAGSNSLDLRQLPAYVLRDLRERIRAGNVIGPGGAWETYRSRKFHAAHAPAATAMILGALEDTGMECVSDYVQSVTDAVKQPMFLRAAEAWEAVSSLRPGEDAPKARALFCRARAKLAVNDFAPAIDLLNESLKLDDDFACSFNALGVALNGVGRVAESRKAFEQAIHFAPAWALPHLQLAQQSMNRGDVRGAVPLLEKAIQLNPRAMGIHWSLARAYRMLGDGPAFLRTADAAIAANRNYAPIYSELGQFHDANHDAARAAQAYQTYLLLAPNYTDSAEVRKRIRAIQPAPAAPRPAAPRQPPTLRKPGEKKR